MLRVVASVLLVAASIAHSPALAADIRCYPVPQGSGPHDVAPAADGTVWYTARRVGALGRLDPKTGSVRQIELGEQSAPHGVIVGPDGAAWVTDSGLNAIVRVDAHTEEVKTFPLPEEHGYANLNTATFDAKGMLWFTGQTGVYGRLDVETGEVRVWEAPRWPLRHYNDAVRGRLLRLARRKSHRQDRRGEWRSCQSACKFDPQMEWAPAGGQDQVADLTVSRVC